jgi:hypothetical protein
MAFYALALKTQLITLRPASAARGNEKWGGHSLAAPSFA